MFEVCQLLPPKFCENDIQPIVMNIKYLFLIFLDCLIRWNAALLESLLVDIQTPILSLSNPDS